jgi:hypothetical protein
MKLLRLVDIQGYEKTPKTNAQKLYNIRKALELLASYSKKIPLRMLACEQEIVTGDSVTIIHLLETIKKAFIFHKH